MTNPLDFRDIGPYWNDEPARGSGPPAVLVLDGGRDANPKLQVALDHPRIEVLTAVCADSALTILEEHQVALILIDARVAEGTAFVAAEQIRSSPRHAATPIIFISTSYPGERALFAGYDRGPTDYLVAPVLPHVLRSKVAVFIELHLQRDALLRQSRLLREAQNVAQLGSWEWIADTDEVNISEELSGVVHRDPIHFGPSLDAYRSLLAPDSAAQAEVALKEAIRSGAPAELDLEIPHPDGDSRWVSARCAAIRGPDSRVIKLRGTVQDITERKRAEEQLRELTRFNQGILDALDAHICVLDERGIILAVNRAWRDFADANGYGHCRAGVGENCLAVCDAATGANSGRAPEMAQGIRDVARGKLTEYSCEYPCHAPEEQRWFVMRASRLHGAGPVRVVIAHTNITARKLAELSLRESEQRFQNAFDQAPIGMALVALNGQIFKANPALCGLLAYDENELVGMTVMQLTHPDDRERDANLLRQLLDGKLASGQIEKRDIRKGGETISLLASRSLVTDASRRPLYFISQLLDITERNHAIARVRRLSQLYAAISTTNEAIVRSASPRDVFRAVCCACVEHGGFSLAWVGVANQASERIMCAEAFGPAMGYLEGLTISTRADLVLGQGPTAVAFREQRVILSNDFGADPITAPWHERAAKFGLASSISLPLSLGGEPIGILTGYGPEKDFFDEEAVRLLKRMAENLAFAMDQFEREQLRREAEEGLRRNAARLQEAQAIGRIGDWETNPSTGEITLSAEALRLLGRGPSEGVPTTGILLSHYDMDSAARANASIRLARDTGERVEVELKLRSSEAREAIHNAVIVPVKNADGRVVRLRGIVQDITEGKKLERERAEQASRIEEFSRRLVAAQEDERRRLSRELHDRTSPNLAAIRINLATLATALPAPLAEEIELRLEDTRALMEDTTASIRDICSELRPAVLDYSGLWATLEGYAQRFTRRTGIAVSVRREGQERRLPADVESAMFRIAQEALTNCAKHALARSVDLTLINGTDWTGLTIADDGVGFELDQMLPGNRRPGLGLLIMRERAEFAGARFNLESSPDGGTRIHVEIDCSQDADAHR
ncbi:MAG: PAS domain S-box protein [Rhodocyclaceae bacterium]